MEILELYKKQYDTVMTDRMRERINPSVKPGSYEYVHIAWRYCFGNIAVVDLIKHGATHEQIQQARADGYIKDSSSNKWIDRGTKYANTRSLTIKGLKALYKNYENW